jgi:hypothetical protein
MVERISSSLQASGIHVILCKAASGKTALVHEVAYHINHQQGEQVFYLDLLTLPKFDDDVREGLRKDVQLISSQRLGSYIVIDNAHIAINDVGDLLQSIYSSYPETKVLMAMKTISSRYYMTVNGNPLIEALEHDELRTIIQGSDITQKIVDRFLERHEIPLEKVEKWGDSIFVIGENLYDLQLLLVALLEETSDSNIEKDLDGRRHMGSRIAEWDHYRREYVAKHLQSIRDRLGDDGIMAVAALAVWSQYDLGIERNFLVGTTENHQITLNIPDSLVDFMIESGDLRDTWGFLRLPHPKIASTYIDTIRSIPAIEASLRQNAYRKIKRTGEFENNILHAYLQYRPHSIDLISKQVCSRGDVLTMISDNPQTIDAIVDTMLSETDLKKMTEIFINFEWLNHKLSEEMLKRLLNSIDRLLPVMKKQSRIGPLTHFIAPMWSVSGDMPEKFGKKLAYDVDWDDINRPIELEIMECQYMQPFGMLDEYRSSVFAKLDESGLSQETKDSCHAKYDNNNRVLMLNCSACIKTFLYKRPLLCTKAPLANNRPGLEILNNLDDVFLANLLNNESEVLDIAYALFVISYFDQALARRIVERLNLQSLTAKICAEEHLESAAYCSGAICAIQPDLLYGLPNNINNYLKSTGWLA